MNNRLRKSYYRKGSKLIKIFSPQYTYENNRAELESNLAVTNRVNRFTSREDIEVIDIKISSWGSNEDNGFHVMVIYKENYSDKE